MSRVRNLIDFNHRVMDMDGDATDNITIDSIDVDTVTADTVTLSSSGTPTLTSATDIKLSASTGVNNRVEVTQSSLKLASFTTAQIALKTGANGDLVYNRTDHQVQAYQNGAWGSISGGGQGTFPTGDYGDLTSDYVALGTVETRVNVGYDMRADTEFKTEDLGPGLVQERTMPTAVQFRRGTTLEHNTFTGAVGELSVDTDKNTVVVHDGTTAGGYPLLVGGEAASFGNLTVTGNLTVQGTTVTVDSATTQTVDLGDNDKIRLGTGNDLEIYHDTNHSYIQESGTGALKLKGDDIRIEDASGNNIIKAVGSGSAELYEAGSKKFETTSTGVDVTGTAVTDGVTVDGTLKINEVIEKVAIDTSTSGLFQAELAERAVVYLTNNQTANRQINFRGDGSTSLDSMLAVGESITMSVLADQGATPYYFNTYTIDGNAATMRWSGGSAPSEGNASGIDVYSFTIIKTASATFTVLGSQTQYA